MRTLTLGLTLALASAAVVPMAMAGSMHAMHAMHANKTVMVGGAAMYPSKNIIQNAVNSKDHTTLVAAVKAAGLVGTLEGKGPFTVFAPTNEAFAALPAGTVQTLLKPENKATLTKILTYHVVPGRLTSSDLAKAVKAGGGKAVLKTVEGDDITIRKDGTQWTVTDDKGGVADITIANVLQSNGVIYVINKVLMP
ncbi:MAG: fasciclin domain-containing protein [Rhodanobacter sp.]|nr:MAG: fasciclin domain-containing protein [Rhodanobacter sp.]